MFAQTRWLAALLVLALGALLASCSGSDGGGSDDEVVSSVEVTIENGTITPSGKRLQTAKDEPFTLQINSDVAGEIHIHSKPEQTVAFEAGETEHEVTFDKPGIFPAESHDPAQVIVEFEVR